MTGALVTRDFVRRLTQLCGMFSSVHDGERAVAALKADTLLRDAGLRWPDVITVVPGAEAPDDVDLDDHRDVAVSCLEHPDILTAWEANFLRCILLFSRLSPKQQATLSNILEKVRAHKDVSDGGQK